MIQNDDTISRQAAIDAFYEMASDIDHLCTVGDYVHVLDGLPSAQPKVDCQKCIFCGFAGFKQFQTAQQPEPTMEEFMYGQDMGNPEDGSL